MPLPPYPISGTTQIDGRNRSLTVSIYLNGSLISTLISDANGDFVYTLMAWSYGDVIRIEISDGEGIYGKALNHKILASEGSFNFSTIAVTFTPEFALPYESSTELNSLQLDRGMMDFIEIFTEDVSDQKIIIRPVTADQASASEPIFFGSAIMRGTSDDDLKHSDGGQGFLGISDYDFMLADPYYADGDAVSFFRNGAVRAMLLPDSICEPGMFLRPADGGCLVPELNGKRTFRSVARAFESTPRLSDHYQLLAVDLL